MPEIGTVYVHIDEDGNAVSVAMHGGKPGAWQGISVARMATPSDARTQEQINDWARIFAAAPDMLAALQDIVKRNEIQHWFNLDLARAAIAKACPHSEGKQE